MNIGQILEVHLGLAAKGIGDKINQMVKEQQELAKFREFLQKVYDLGDTRQKVDIASLSDDEVRTLIKNLRGGLPIATPVFDGAPEASIKALLELADLPTSGYRAPNPANACRYHLHLTQKQANPHGSLHSKSCRDHLH